MTRKWLRLMVLEFEAQPWSRIGFRGLGFEIWGLGFRVWGLGFGVWGLGFGV